MSNLRLRVWQQEAFDQCIHSYTVEKNKSFLINAAPGAGKTKCSIAIAKKLIDLGEIEKVIVVAPMNTVVENWADDFYDIVGEEMSKITTEDSDFSEGDHYCATWQGIKGSIGIFQELCNQRKCLFIGDEVHHAALEKSWGLDSAKAFKNSKYDLTLSGTPVRSDGGKVAFQTYEGVELLHDADSSYVYSYGRAVDEGICRPVKFIPHEGKFSVKYSDDEEIFKVSGGKDTIVPSDFKKKIKSVPGFKNATNFYFLTQKPQYLSDKVTPDIKQSFQASLLREADEYLEIARQRLPNAAALVIAPTIKMAAYMKKLIKMMFDEDAVIVHNEVADSQRKIKIFRKSNNKKKWIVSVQMISEGVDIPRLRLLVHLPKAKTELSFRQALGRIVRSIDPPHDKSFAYVIMPKLKDFERHSRNILREMSPKIKAMLQKANLEKVCSVCTGKSPIGAKACLDCGTPFPKRKVSEVECSKCEHLNPITLKECEKCGEKMVPEFSIKLDSAYNTGMVIQGLTIAQKFVDIGQENEKNWIDHLEKLGNEGLAGLDLIEKYGAETIALIKSLPENKK